LAEADGEIFVGDHVQVQQIVLNLALNAMDAMQSTVPDERVLSISTRSFARRIELTVADRGHGLSEDAGRRLFEPFYTTKAHGMGLGLSIVRTIVEAHHGHVDAVARDGGGTVFIVKRYRSWRRSAKKASQAVQVTPSTARAPAQVGQQRRESAAIVIRTFKRQCKSQT